MFWLRYGQIIEDARLVLESLRNWNIRHVKREANFVAHGLAKIAIRILMDNIWLEEPSSCIYDIIIFYMSTQEGEMRIRISDIYFIRRGPNRLSYLYKNLFRTLVA